MASKFANCSAYNKKWVIYYNKHNTRGAKYTSKKAVKISEQVPVAAVEFFNGQPEEIWELDNVKFKNLIHTSLIYRPIYYLNEQETEQPF